MKTTKTLFLAWQDPISRFWFPIGRLTFDGSVYQFVYTQGVKEAEEKSAFKPLSSFPCLDEVYTSTQLFPVFVNRLMSQSRPDYQRFIEWLNIPNDEHDPLTILARSGGERETDTLAVVPCPEVDERGSNYEDNLIFLHKECHKAKNKKLHYDMTDALIPEKEKPKRKARQSNELKKVV